MAARHERRAARPAATALFVAAILHGTAARADEPAPPPALDSPAVAGAKAAAPELWPRPVPRYRLLATSILGASYNSDGVEELVRLGLQMRLYRSDSPAFRDNFVFVGVNPRLNPTAARLGPTIEVQPLSVFNLKLNVEFVDYFGLLSTLQSFSSPLAAFDAATRERNHEAGKSYGTTGVRLSITPFFQMKVGPIALRNRFTLEYLAIGLRGGDTVFYEPAFDTLTPGKGTFLSDDLDLFYVQDLPAGGFFSHGRIAAGLRYSGFKPLFDETDFRPGEDRSKENNEVHRMGPLVAVTLFDDGYTKFHEPTIVAMAQWYAAHPNRTGKDSDQAVPYLVLAFIFQSDLWTSEAGGQL